MLTCNSVCIDFRRLLQYHLGGSYRKCRLQGFQIYSTNWQLEASHSWEDCFECFVVSECANHFASILGKGFNLVYLDYMLQDQENTRSLHFECWIDQPMKTWGHMISTISFHEFPGSIFRVSKANAHFHAYITSKSFASRNLIYFSVLIR